MSFKRDGDDKCALDNQRKRRVAELLCEEIEEDEVTRLSNGKYKCKLCSHQPIFDTLSMFYVHKQGKKHQYSIEYAAQQKQELADLIEKRKQEHVTKTGPATEGDTVSMATGSKTFGMKKPRRPHDRKPIIDFNISPGNKEVLPVPIETTLSSFLPGNRSYNANGTATTTTSAPQKPFGESVRTSSSTGRSYRIEDKHLATGADKDTKAFNMWNKSRTASQQYKDHTVISAKNVHKLVGQSNTELSSKFYLSRKKQREDTGSMFRNNGVGIKDDDLKPSTSPAQTWEYYKDFKGKVPFKMKSSDKHVSKVSSSSEEAKDLPKQETISSTANTAEDCSSQEKKERAEKFLNAIGPPGQVGREIGQDPG